MKVNKTNKYLFGCSFYYVETIIDIISDALNINNKDIF